MLRRSAIKRKSHYKPVELERFHDYVAEQGCLVCGGAAEVHHVSGYADKPGRIGRSDWLVTPLCPGHHRLDAKAAFPTSVQGLGHQGFYDEWGIDLYAEAMRLAETYQRRIAA